MIRRCIRALALASAPTVVVAVGVSAAATRPSPLVPGGGSVAGRGYAHWVAAAWRWRLSQPRITSNRTSCFTAGQHGPVWFIGSTVTAAVYSRTCAIPAGRYLMLYTPITECSTVEPPPFHATTNAGLMRCAKRLWERGPGWLTLTLDGVNIQPAGHVGGSPAFAFQMPAHDNFLRVPGRTHGRAAVYGFGSILRPLSRGTHTLVQTDGFSKSSIYNKITYKLTVG
jgi:hypothetical protein